MTIARNSTFTAIALAALIGLTSIPMTGCDSFGGGNGSSSTSRGTTGAVIGGAAGAVLGAVISKQNRLLGALIGGALGAGGGYLIGAKTDWFGKDKSTVRNEAQNSVDNAQTNPATPEEARRASTADINSDGFVTLDEVIAMKRASLSDSQMIKRLEATGQVFDLNQEQQQFLLDNGISHKVIDRMLTMNTAARDRYLSNSSSTGGDVISRDPNR